MSNAPSFSDWLAIVSLKARYCRLLDTKDWAGWEELFTEDFTLDTSAAGGQRIAGRAAAISYVRSSITDDTITTHHVHNPEISIAGNTASAIWAMQDRNIWPNGRQLLGFGHYHEDYLRVGDEWKIAVSRLTRLNVEMSGKGSVI